MKRRSLLKAIGAVLFGAGISEDTAVWTAGAATAGDNSRSPITGLSTTCGTWGSGLKVETLADIKGAAPADDSRKDWKLYRALYGYDGLEAVEGQTCDNERFKDALESGDYEDGWIIGRPFQWNNETHIVTVLEGKKETLEYVMGLMQAENARFGGPCTFTATIDDAVWHGTCLNEYGVNVFAQGRTP